MCIKHELAMEASNSVNVLVYGSAIVDFICYVDRLPKPGETLLGTKFTNGFGGKGANQCVAAARLGSNTAFIAKVGDDTWGNDYIKHLQEEGVNIDYVQKCEGKTTGIAQIAVSDDGENNIIIVPGANDYLDQDIVAEASSLFNTAKILLCQLETPPMGTLKALKSFKGISILNAAPAMANTPKELLACCTILCVNETEAAVMTGVNDIKTIYDAREAAIKLREMGASTIIVTLGSQGAIYIEKSNPQLCIHVPAHKVNVVDTTGAGDAFLGSLAYHMEKFPEKPLHQHIGFANYQAAYSVQFPGTQSSFASASMSNQCEEYAFETI
ncbi:ribokinase isoform X2 [Haematobia irritans]|uniref:ribokinase isoform X2 n=1 Tax=Haematobia irritans TaxID=7368 RepID=UPI003F50917A